MTMQKTLFGLALLVAASIAGARANDAAPRSVPAPAATVPAGDARRGEATFTQYCSICHNSGGKGFIGPHIGGITWTVPGLHTIVRGGLGGYGGMPAFNADVVTDRNIADIEAYLASLAPAPSAQPPIETPAATVVATQAQTAGAAPAIANVQASATPLTTTTAQVTGDRIHGRQIFTANCAACHGASGQGGFGPSLRGESARKDTAAAMAWIKNPKPPMPKLYPDPLSAKDVEDVTAYVESL
jgi:mono/diheme cytochrome c family protein